MLLRAKLNMPDCCKRLEFKADSLVSKFPSAATLTIQLSSYITISNGRNARLCVHWPDSISTLPFAKEQQQMTSHLLLASLRKQRRAGAATSCTCCRTGPMWFSFRLTWPQAQTLLQTRLLERREGYREGVLLQPEIVIFLSLSTLSLILYEPGL